MGTPLQVTIMTLLLERRPRPPQDRHGLFEAYFDTIYSREAGKPGHLAALLSSHKPDVNAIHEEVGLRLQVLAEGSGDAEAAMPESSFEAIVRRRLTAEGHQPADVGRLASQLVKAATQRLVLLVPKADGEVGFEIRSLRGVLGGTSYRTRWRRQDHEPPPSRCTVLALAEHMVAHRGAPVRTSRTSTRPRSRVAGVPRLRHCPFARRASGSRKLPSTCSRMDSPLSRRTIVANCWSTHYACSLSR